MIKVDLNVDLRKIPSLTFPELKEYYDALFNIPTTSTRKEYYVWAHYQQIAGNALRRAG